MFLDSGSVLNYIKFYLCIYKHHTIRVNRGVEIWLHTFLTSSVSGGYWSALCSSCSSCIKESMISFELETGLAPELVWILCGRQAWLTPVKAEPLILGHPIWSLFTIAADLPRLPLNCLQKIKEIRIYIRIMMHLHRFV
jgi:hypothetical protein